MRKKQEMEEAYAAKQIANASRVARRVVRGRGSRLTPKKVNRWAPKSWERGRLKGKKQVEEEESSEE